MDFITAGIESASLPNREVGLAAVTSLAKDVGTPAAPFLAPLLPTILTTYADKVRAIMILACEDHLFQQSLEGRPLCSIFALLGVGSR